MLTFREPDTPVTQLNTPNGNFTLKSWLSMIVLGGLGWYGQYLVLTGKL